ncbi:MAG: thioredoxin family protein [Planctomycetia bacterium]|nr:thioredoxin family protein [Planctomycetia bacterium]
MFRCLSAVLVAGVVAVVGSAGEFNKVVKIGDAAPAFSGLPGVDDKNHSLGDYKKDVVVIAVTCNHCPVAVAYEDRMIAFAKKYADKVDFIAINVNNLEADKLPAMKVRAKDKGFNFPYLYDESQKIGKEYGATVTPEFFVLNKERKIVYMGAFDNKQNGATENFLEPAVEAALKGSAPTKAETKPFGCGVKYDK